ncbi:MAG: peptidoglycan synthetase [Flavobacteriales bacterium]|nr:peptidoglycan synthetase [Flavobacteriales bacterium]
MRIHFISIGGSAMHNLAIALSNEGNTISGSDDIIFEPSKGRLKKYGLLPEKLGWDAERINTQIDAIVLGMHAKNDNPELLRAKELNLKIYSYPEFLYNQSKDKTRVVIGGSHGKTTITSMVLHVVNDLNIAVDYMVGAQLDGYETMVKLTEENKFIVLEGDEYLSSALDLRPKFHLYKPNVALLTGIAWDHINVFPTFENYVEQFKIFVDKIVDGGTLVYNNEDENIVAIVENSKRNLNFISYSTPKYKIEGGKYVIITEEGEFELEIFGKHNLQNLEGAKELCKQMGIDYIDFYKSISSFRGASRRLEEVYKDEKHLVYKDFAHSPSKVAASVSAVSERFVDDNKLVVLELHTYSSLNPKFLKEYKGSLDTVSNPLVYVDSEIVKNKRMDKITEDQIKIAFAKDDLLFFDKPEELKAYVLSKMKSTDVALFMSSGNLGGLELDKLV